LRNYTIVTNCRCMEKLKKCEDNILRYWQAMRTLMSWTSRLEGEVFFWFWWNASVGHNQIWNFCFYSCIVMLLSQTSKREKRSTFTCYFWRPGRTTVCQLFAKFATFSNSPFSSNLQLYKGHLLTSHLNFHQLSGEFLLDSPFSSLHAFLHIRAFCCLSSLIQSYPRQWRCHRKLSVRGGSTVPDEQAL